MREGPAPSRTCPPFAKPLGCSRLRKNIADVIDEQGLNVICKGKHVHVHNLEGLAVEVIVVLALFRAVKVIDMMIPCSGDASPKDRISYNIHREDR